MDALLPSAEEVLGEKGGKKRRWRRLRSWSSVKKTRGLRNENSTCLGTATHYQKANR
ncbi:hypothetical protein DPMN_089049 [Dreissena polymorpha]|uniref:Uncharacterized protein n=1 Tax=Dreissena polymorpha TaxID=45954 RepID=A0A9D4KXF9_DREPO|nr:hypothetical protein DPMN_089049 [Dreissena polymorpha]